MEVEVTEQGMEVEETNAVPEPITTLDEYYQKQGLTVQNQEKTAQFEVQTKKGKTIVVPDSYVRRSTNKGKSKSKRLNVNDQNEFPSLAK